MLNIKTIIINKNRGWRGLASIKCMNSIGAPEMSQIFSFSQPMWNDMLRGYIVVQDLEHYHVIEFEDKEKLPMGQRSVLIKNFTANVIAVHSYTKSNWPMEVKTGAHYVALNNYTKNRNNHTESDWNCIGIRVVPMI